MIEIRPLHEDEWEKAQQFVPDQCAEPQWATAWAVLKDNELVGVFGLATKLVVEPLYMKKDATLHAFGTMTWIDGFLRGYAAQHGHKAYEFFVQDINEHFQRFIEKNLPVEVPFRQVPGITYTRKFKE